jgi:hypothetical protein
MTSNITIFKNIKETDAPFHRPIGHLIERIRNGASKDLVKRIRKEQRKAERNELKKQLPAICFSGRFTKRNDNSIQEHSGFICLDFDGYEKSREMLQDKENITKSPYTYSVFVSPSGQGLKVIVKIPQDIDNHVNYFNSLQKHFNNPKFDVTCKNLSRVCYESYDPLIFVNENSSIWDKIEEREYQEKNQYRDAPTIPITDENKIVDILVKWWVKKYPMVEGQRNHNCYVLASAFNDFGINKSLAGYVMSNYRSEDFNENEIHRTIESAYSNTANFGSKYYEDEERLHNLKIKLKRGASKKELRTQLEDSNLDSEVIEAVITRIDEEAQETQFWMKSDKGVVRIIHVLFKQFLEDNGFYKYCPEGSKNYVFVKVTDNLIDHTDEKEIKDFVLNNLIEIDDLSIYNHFADKVRYFKEDFLTLLSTIDVYFIEDNKDTSYLYYRNCAVKITKDDLQMIDYLDLGGYVWKDHVIDRNFSECDLDTDYSKFIYNICNGEQDRISAMNSTIGFLMHAHKNLSFCPAVILNDEVISDNPEGGTGKGMFMNALSQMKKVVTIDGKSFTFERSFAYQLVSADTQILVFDDVRKHFEFERLFSVVTEGLTLEKKNKDAIKIPFEKSPKIAITTNYAIKGSGNSFARRKWELELHQHYSKNYTPLDEFGKLFFGDWNDGEWCAFDNYMIGCLQGYLNTGLIESKFVNLKIRQLSAETSHDFIEWCGLINGSQDNPILGVDIKISLHTAYLDFIEQYPDYAPKAKLTISRIKFNKWMSSYASFKSGTNPQEGRDMAGRWLRIKRDDELVTQKTLNV